MRRTIPGAAAAVLVSATLLAGCAPLEPGGSTIEPDIDDPGVTQEDVETDG